MQAITSWLLGRPSKMVKGQSPPAFALVGLGVFYLDSYFHETCRDLVSLSQVPSINFI